MNSKACAGSQRRSRFGKWDPKAKNIFFLRRSRSVTITAHAVGGTITVIVLFEVRE